MREEANRRVRNVNIEGRNWQLITNTKVKRKSHTGKIIFAGIVAGVVVAASAVGAKNAQEEKAQVAIEAQMIEEQAVLLADTKELAECHIVMENSGLNEQAYQDVLKEMKEQGIPFKEYSENEGVMESDTVISLTSNAYVDGQIALYGPKEHENKDHDNLMVSFMTAVDAKEMKREDIHFGRDQDGRVITTSLEDRTSGRGNLITLQFNENADLEKAPDLVIDGLVRFSKQRKAEPGKTYFHTMQAADTFNGIAGEYGLSISSLSSMNRIENENSIRMGQVLRVSSMSSDILNPSTVVKTGNQIQK